MEGDGVIATGVACPYPGSVLKKYSIRVIFCAMAVMLKRIKMVISQLLRIA
jgi:hypothetical protein